MRRDQAAVEMLTSFGINGAQGYLLERPNPDYRPARSARTAPVTGKLRFG